MVMGWVKGHFRKGRWVDGHWRNSGSSGYTPTPPPVSYGAPSSPPSYGQYASYPPPHAQPKKGVSPWLIAVLVPAWLMLMFAGCVVCLGASAPKKTASAPPPLTPAATPELPKAAEGSVQKAAPAPAPKLSTTKAVTPKPVSPPPPPAAAPVRGGSGRAKCCDGSVSPSCSCGGGRGCCSHHGGVCGCD